MPGGELGSDAELGWFQQEVQLPFWGPAGIKLLKLNQIPKHIAFIMDGNRRYARTNRLDSAIKGHTAGFEQLTKVLEWCNELGVREISCYAFSIENFKRSAEEVDGLMNMAEKKFERLLQEKEKLREKQVRFRFFGHLAKLPLKIQRLIAQIELFTKDFDVAFLNVCLAYTAQDEIARGIETLRLAKRENIVQNDDIDPELIAAALDTADSHPVDMLIRTSGEQRLSDFMLWQTASPHCYMHFDRVLWPDFGFYNLFVAVLKYQMHHVRINSLPEPVNCIEQSEQIARLRDFSRRKRFENWTKLIETTSSS